MIAFVLSVTSSATRSGSMLRSESRTSANTGFAPAWTITFAVAGQVIGVVITSSPGSTPTASSERCSAAVPEATASTCSAWTYSAKRRSSSAERGPVVSQPERRVSATASISSSPIAGGWNPSMVFLLSDETFCTDLEAYETSSLVGSLQRLFARVAASRAPHPRGRRRGGTGRRRGPARGRSARRGRPRRHGPPRRLRPPGARPRAGRGSGRPHRRPAGVGCSAADQIGSPSAAWSARPLRSTPSASFASSASCPPPRRAATSITCGPSGPIRSCV